VRRARARSLAVWTGAVLLVLTGCGSDGGALAAPSVTTAPATLRTPSMTAAPSPTPAEATTPAPTATVTTPVSTAPTSPPSPHVTTASRTTSKDPASSSTPSSRLMGTDWERLPTSEPVVALTFDGGSSEAGVASVLATLAAHGVRATVFLTGDFARRYPAQVRSIAAAGHVIGNHSDRHASYVDLTDAQIRSDLARAQEAIVAAGGGPEAGRYFRFPFGARTPADIRVVNAEGYVTVRWTVDTLGWKGTSGGLSAAQVRNRVLSQAQAGQIVLMHLGANPVDGTTLDADALAGVITGLKDRGYSFVTVDELLS